MVVWLQRETPQGPAIVNEACRLCKNGLSSERARAVGSVTLRGSRWRKRLKNLPEWNFLIPLHVHASVETDQHRIVYNNRPLSGGSLAREIGIARGYV
jgi:hypothetical protein